MKEFFAYWVVTIVIFAVLGVASFVVYGCFFQDHATKDPFEWMGSGLLLSLFVSVPGYLIFRIVVSSFRMVFASEKK